ncbi:MAG: ABC transporter permease [Bacteroidales bacterium]|nr:ABC transporter permease [Bacteroidales bacterium]
MRKSFLLSIRNLIKHKTNSLINLVGLTVAISSLMLIILWIRGELSYDRFHNNANNIYRIVDGNPADKESWAGSPSPLGGFLKENFPEVLSFSRFEVISRVVKANNIAFNENRIAVMDTSFFDIFSFPLIRGTIKNVRFIENSILLSESTASRYFGNSDPVGKTLILGDTVSYEIIGVFQDVPVNSHIRFDLAIPFENIYSNDNWGAWNYFTYILVDPGANPDDFKDKTIQWAQKNRPDKLDIMKELYYQPLKQIHFQFNRKNLEPTIEKTSIRAAVLVAFLILLIACINYTNLSTIQSIERAREIAVRKIMGESQSLLRMIMIAEAILISVFSLFLSIIIVENFLPVFNRLLDSHITISLNDRIFILTAIGLVFITSLFSGTYPAFILSSFRPVDLFKNSFRIKGKQSMRTVLVVAQFSISIVLMICLFVIHRQMEFIHTKKLGMSPENVVNIRLQSESVARHAKELKEELLRNPEVISASVNSFRPSTHNEHWGISFNEKTNDGTNENMGLWIILADKDFIKTMQINIIEGEELIDNYTASETPFILNESAARFVKGDEVVGKEFEFFDGYQGKIIGKVKDFHFRSLHHKLEPAAIIFFDQANQISLRINSNDIQSTLSSLEKTWNKFSPDLKIDYYFMDEDLNQLYKSEIKTNKLLMAAGILSMFLCCLGIFGIVTYSAKRRSKEIGIRKVNGSSSLQIMAMLLKNYTWWIVISFIIACPLAYFFMHQWLQNFAYRTNMVWWVFAVSGIIAYLIALLTAGFQSWRVANQNPVEALRYE